MREERQQPKGQENIIYDQLELHTYDGWLQSNVMHSNFS